MKPAKPRARERARIPVNPLRGGHHAIGEGKSGREQIRAREVENRLNEVLKTVIKSLRFFLSVKGSHWRVSRT